MAWCPEEEEKGKEALRILPVITLYYLEFILNFEMVYKFNQVWINVFVYILLVKVHVNYHLCALME
jgi:hypothetical protein